MMKKFSLSCPLSLSLLFLLAAAAAAGAAEDPLRSVDQYIHPVDSPLYEAIGTLYHEQGIARPSASGPWSAGELRSMLARIEYDRLSDSGRNLYDTVKRELAQGLSRPLSDDFQMKIGFEAAFETYIHTNSEHFDDEWDWVVGYAERLPVALLSFEFALHDWFYTYSELGYKKNRFAWDDETSSVSSSLLYEPLVSFNLFDVRYVDFETPYRAFVSAGGKGWNLQLGRDLLKWGAGRTGNLVIGSHLDYHDFLSFRSYHEHFTYQLLTLFFDFPGWTAGGDPMNPTHGEVPSGGVQAFLGHRVEFRLWDRIGLALTENVMYNHDFYDLRYFNPAYIYHNFNNREMFNAIASLEVDAQLFPGLNVYGQYVLDQARAPNEGDSQPDCMGYLGGIDISLPGGPGRWIGGLEYVYTDPYLYQRDLIDFKVSRRQFTAIGGSFSTHFDYLGYQYGGDAIVFDITGGYELPLIGRVQAGYRSIVRGEIGVDEVIDAIGDYPNRDDATPSGDTPEVTRIISLEGSLDLGRLFAVSFPSGLRLKGSLHYLVVENRGNIPAAAESDLQAVIGISVGL